MTTQSPKNYKLKVFSLGGWSQVNQNMFIYETKNDILVVDCGVGFPDQGASEIEVILPDITYLKDKKKKIRGIVISHGHEDHFGALPYLLPQLDNPPVYATRLVNGFIQAKLREFGLATIKFHLIEPEKDFFRVGQFKIFPFRVNHSVPDSLGLCLETSVGKIFHVSDFKFDLTPTDGKVFQIKKAARLAHPQVLALFSDCLGAVTSGFTSSEQEIEKIFDQIIAQAKGQLFVTTVSSNISRFQQAIAVSLKHDRKVVILGRSVEEKIKIARQLNYLRLNKKNLVSAKEAKKLPQNKLTYLISGSYGQSDSALSRLAEGNYRDARLEKGAVVVFSADPAPPGSRETTDTLVDKLTLKGAKVYYYEIQENLHVSGHGSADDIRLLFALIKPKYFIPIGGNPRHIRAYSFLAQDMGAKEEQILELFNGEILEFKPGQAQIADRIEFKGIPVESK